MNKLFTLVPVFLLISGCSAFGLKENTKLETELYILNSKINPISISDDISKFDSNLPIENFISNLPSESESKLLYKSKIENYLNTTTEFSSYHFNPKDFKNKPQLLTYSGAKNTDKTTEEIIENLIKEQRHISSFNFKINLLNLNNNSSTQKIEYNMEFLKKIAKKDNGLYVAEYQEVSSDLTNTLNNNEYKVLSILSLEDNSNSILIYKANIKK